VLPTKPIGKFEIFREKEEPPMFGCFVCADSVNRQFAMSMMMCMTCGSSPGAIGG
jgi:hypothetical protein